MPQHRLNLKVGAPIILIRNFNRAAGLMNGTRLSVTSCLRYTNQAKVLRGTQKGNSVCIPRINLTVSDDDDLPIKFIRRQFPVKLAFCMTINKSQGQTFSKWVSYWQPDRFYMVKFMLLYRAAEIQALSKYGQQRTCRLTQTSMESLKTSFGRKYWTEIFHISQRTCHPTSTSHTVSDGPTTRSMRSLCHPYRWDQCEP